MAVGTAESRTVGFCNYLGEVSDPETGQVRELYGKQLEAVISVEIRGQRAADCETGCETAAEVLLGGLPSGIRPGELRWEALSWERETEMFPATGTAAVPGLVSGPDRGRQYHVFGFSIEGSSDQVSEIMHERPGVYSSYDASAVISAGRAAKVIGVAAKAAKGTAGEVVTLTGYAAGVAAFGEDGADTPGMSTILRLLFANGAATVTAVRVAEAGAVTDYQDAFAALGQQAAQILVCDSAEETVQQALRTAVEDASAARRERIAVVGGERRDGGGAGDPRGGTEQRAHGAGGPRRPGQRRKDAARRVRRGGAGRRHRLRPGPGGAPQRGGDPGPGRTEYILQRQRH